MSWQQSGRHTAYGVKPCKNSGQQGLGTVEKPCFCSLTYQNPHDEGIGRSELYTVKHRGVRTKLGAKTSLIFDVTVTHLIKTTHVSLRINTLATYKKTIQLVSSETPYFIVSAAKISFSVRFVDFVQRCFSTKDGVFAICFFGKYGACEHLQNQN